MKIPKVIGGSQSQSGTMLGQNVPMKSRNMATQQPSRAGFKAQGSLVGHVAAIPGMGTPATKTLKNAPFNRPANAPKAKGTLSGGNHNYSGKKPI